MLRKYLTVFKLSWERLFEYRFNLLMGTVRSLILLLTFYFLWTTVFTGKAGLFGFNRAQILTYVLGANFLSSFIFIHSMNKIADEIADGQLSLHLLKPVNFLAYWFIRQSALRLMSLLWTIAETVVFLVLVKPQLLIELNFEVLILGPAALLLALILFTVLDSLAGLTSFWTFRAYGPRFAFTMLMEFTSGRFFPLNFRFSFSFR